MSGWIFVQSLGISTSIICLLFREEMNSLIVLPGFYIGGCLCIFGGVSLLFADS